MNLHQTRKISGRYGTFTTLQREEQNENTLYRKRLIDEIVVLASAFTVPRYSCPSVNYAFSVRRAWFAKPGTSSGDTNYPITTKAKNTD